MQIALLRPPGVGPLVTIPWAITAGCKYIANCLPTPIGCMQICSLHCFGLCRFVPYTALVYADLFHTPLWCMQICSYTALVLQSSIYHIQHSIYHLQSSIYHLQGSIYHLQRSIHHLQSRNSMLLKLRSSALEWASPVSKSLLKFNASGAHGSCSRIVVPINR